MAKLSLEQLERVDVDTFKSMPKKPIIVIVDNVRSALNVGSIFRTSDAFAIAEIYLCGITATPPNREITKTAIGATESVAWQYFENTIDAVSKAKSLGYKTYAIEQTSESISLDQWNYNGHAVAIVLGNEVDGVDEQVVNQTDGCIEIPQFGTKHSLNVSVCAGIVLWELVKKG